MAVVGRLQHGNSGAASPLRADTRHAPPPQYNTLQEESLRSQLQGLTKLLADNAPGCMKEQKFENYFGRKIAVDASMHIYAFMVRVGEIVTCVH